MVGLEEVDLNLDRLPAAPLYLMDSCIKNLVWLQLRATKFSRHYMCMYWDGGAAIDGIAVRN
eukprot:SAG31_NODE_1513_length_8045_cov_5.748804_9_plen_62_part_00